MADKNSKAAEEWAATGPVVDPKYNPREDPGPQRVEDDPKFIDKHILRGRTLAKSDSKEVPLEDSYRDDTSALASDAVELAEAPPEG